MHLSFNRRPSGLLIAVATLLIPLAAPIAARADDGQGAVGVARISLIDGSVAVQRGDTAAPIDAVVNAPVLAADYITTGDASHAEVQFDGAAALRLGDNVQMRFTRIDPGNRQLQLAQGTVELRLMQGSGGENAIDTPSISIHPLDAGSYRVTVDPDGHTVLTVRSGRAEVALPQGNQIVESGAAIEAQGAASSPAMHAIEAVAMDDFDNFNNDRESHEAPALAQNGGGQYVSPNVPGVADLNADGRWVQDNQYGPAWVPTDVAADWAPYRDGRWVYENYYGWTWVGAEPWGWAPYHYGRWFHSASFGWAWYPGPRVAVSAWSPALVAFVGFGGGFGIGFGNIGWVPLAPFEAFHPWWGRGVSSVNIAFSNFGANHFRNAGFNGATFVSHERFLEGRFDHAGAMTPGQFRSAQVMHGSLPVAPTRANLRFNDRPVASNLATRQSFAERGFASGNGRFSSRAPLEERGSVGVTRSAPSFQNRTSDRTSVAPTGRGTSNDAWSRFGNQRGSGPTVIDGTRTLPNGNAGTGRPSFTNGANSFQRPSYSNGANSFQRPANTNGANTFQRPSSNNGANTFSRPSYNNGANTYQRPSYNNRANTYSRPSYNNGGSYQRPSYNNGGSYQRPAQTNRQPSYSAPARTQQNSRSSSQNQRSNDRGHR
jgi:hypothetical protein